MTNQVTDNPLERLVGEMTLLEHLEELRDRLVKAAIAVLIGTVISTIFTKQILQFLIAPYGQQLQLISPTEGIAVYFRVALTAGVILAMPFLVYQLLMFVLPGLESGEKRYIIWGVPSATLLFLAGVAFAWFILIPAAIGFLSGFLPDVFDADWRSNEYIPFVTSLIFWIGVSFETPLIIFIMSKIGIVTPQFLIKQWRFAVLIIAIAAAMITPTPDPFNMALVMLPLFVLYGFSILLSYLA
ncbi:MAG TPA: twin-arginine translocase subunit TatC [Anaerolineae bacterium]|nr:twin-arginine translocase subunit TatC [Anaerolineae bacterium]